MLASVWRVSCAIVPGLRSPVSGSVDSMPDRKMNSPARMPGLCGRLKLRETLSRSFRGATISRATDMALSPESDDGDGVELHLERVDDAHAPHGARRRHDNAGERRVSQRFPHFFFSTVFSSIS